MPPLLVDLIHARACKPFCEKSLTLPCLSEREKKIITMRYGLDNRPPRTQREIAAESGISRSYVSRRR